MRRQTDHPLEVYVYTGAIIVAGIVAFLWTAQSFPIAETISLTASGGSEGVFLGLAFWTLLGLAGGMRVERLHGHGVLTFHFPFIIAAAALGGPTAAAVVALISTLERREFRDAPWYGIASNHASYTLAAIAGSLVMLAVRGGLGLLGFTDPQAIEVVAIAAGSLVLALTATALCAGTIVLRDRLTVREAFSVFDSGYRATAAAEVILGWMLWLTYSMIGWWASMICAAFVLVIWSAHDDRERARYDPLSGLLSRAAFDVRLSEALAGFARHQRPLALIGIDLDGFKAVNDLNGHVAGDEVIREVGARLRASIRLTDAAVRRGGDEFGVLLADVENDGEAMEITERILETIRRPVDFEDRTLSVGASVGLYVLRPDRRVPSVAKLHDMCDRLMYWAKFHGGGIRSNVRPHPDQPDVRDD
jgi:diguanylate cyclase (GGDEF)-like protein